MDINAFSGKAGNEPRNSSRFLGLSRCSGDHYRQRFTLRRSADLFVVWGCIHKLSESLSLLKRLMANDKLIHGQMLSPIQSINNSMTSKLTFSLFTIKQILTYKILLVTVVQKIKNIVLRTGHRLILLRVTSHSTIWTSAKKCDTSQISLLEAIKDIWLPHI